MFNLADILKPQKSTSINETALNSVLFFQTHTCHELVLEAFRFEGIKLPAVLENSDANIKAHVRDADIEIVLVELNSSANITQDMERISHLLPNNASVIVIGSEDAISTIRNLKAMGYYYLFWPVTKQELIDFIRSVTENRLTNSGLGKNRSAKRVAVWGSKGGVGTSIFSAEVAFQLAQQKKSSCIVVDRNFTGGNLDIIMGLAQFEKKHISKAVLSDSLDISYSVSLTQQVDDLLSILSLTSEDLNYLELADYIGLLNRELGTEKNFIIEDFSGSVHSKQDLNYIAKNCDSVVLMIQPTVSSVREAAKVKSYLEKIDSPARLLLVLNYTMPEKTATVTPTEIEKNLQHKIDIITPFEANINFLFLQGKRLYEQNSAIGKSLQRLTSLLVGESIDDNKGNFLRRLMKSA